MTRTCAHCGHPYEPGYQAIRQRHCSPECRYHAELSRRRARRSGHHLPPDQYAGAGPHHLGSVTHGRARAAALWRLAESCPTPTEYAERKGAILAGKP